MVVPLLAGCIIATFAPDLPKFFGSFTAALFSGALPILAVFYVCMGSTIDLKMTGYIAKKGGSLFATKILLGVILGLIAGHFLGERPIDQGFFAGLSALGLVAAINDTNGGLYMALVSRYGRAEDAAAYSIMSIESGPFLTMMSLGVAGLSAFPWQTLVGSVLPLVCGMILGNIDFELREFLGRAVPVMIPFFAFALGGTLNWASGATAGLLGIGLGLFVVVGSGIFLILTDRVTGGTGTAGLAAATTRECSRGSNARGCSQSGLRQCRQNGNGVDYGCGCHYRSDSAFFHCLVGPTLCQIWRTSGMKDCLILADDLSGAADSAVSALRAGLDAEVFLTAEAAQESSTAVVAFVSAPRPLLMVVKAGGFGDPDTLRNAYRFLKEIRISHE